MKTHIAIQLSSEVADAHTIFNIMIEAFPKTPTSRLDYGMLPLPGGKELQWVCDFSNHRVADDSFFDRLDDLLNDIKEHDDILIYVKDRFPSKFRRLFLDEVDLLAFAFRAEV